MYVCIEKHFVLYFYSITCKLFKSKVFLFFFNICFFRNNKRSYGRLAGWPADWLVVFNMQLRLYSTFYNNNNGKWLLPAFLMCQVRICFSSFFFFLPNRHEITIKTMYVCDKLKKKLESIFNINKNATKKLH